MAVGAQVWKGVNPYITNIFLNSGLARKEEVCSIEENKNIKKTKNTLSKQGHRLGSVFDF
jgi:hypothetical protein